jgi:hypothetical protein
MCAGRGPSGMMYNIMMSLVTNTWLLSSFGLSPLALWVMPYYLLCTLESVHMKLLFEQLSVVGSIQ